MVNCKLICRMEAKILQWYILGTVTFTSSSYFSLSTNLWFRSNELSNETTFDRTDLIPQQHIGTEEIN